MNTLLNRLKLGGSAVAFAAIASFAGAASAQTPAPDASDAGVEEVVVTGTSIRGIAPVGSNLITVGSQDIESMGAATVQDVLVNVPSLTGMGNVNQGTTNSSSYAPVIHQLGASASNSTLVLIDGHRLPSDGQNHGLTDPNIVPVSALQEVDVLPDGASSIYGSDAVAGVVNFVTRKHYDGLQISAQDGFGRGYRTTEANGLWGTSWTGGSVLFAAGYSNKGGILNADEPQYINNNWTARAIADGLPVSTSTTQTNFNTYNCYPATIQANGSTTTIYQSATATSPIAKTTGNASCTSPYGNFLDPEKREEFMVKGVQQVGNVTVSLDLLYAIRADNTSTPYGSVTATVFGSGAQANPFYTNPPGVTTSKQTVNFNLAGLLPGSSYSQVSNSGNQVGYIRPALDWNIDDNYHLTVSAVIGSDRLYANTYNGLCTACVDLALNGTTSSGGSTAGTTSVSLPTTTTTVSMLPLTTTNALDIWNPVATNRTSQAVLKSLGQAQTQSNTYDQLQNYRVNLDGSPFTLPGGPLRIAVGAETTQTGEKAFADGAGTLGPSSTSSTATNFEYARTVYAMYGEVEIPIIGAGNALPFVQKFDFDVSGRYDDYSDVGTTANPKFAATWEVIDGLKFRGSYSTSFVAPALDSIGKPPSLASNSAAFNVPIAAYPNVTQIGLPAGSCTATTCAVPSSFQGVILSGADNLVPEKGRGWSVGTDIAPDFLPGFVLSATLFDAEFIGGVTSPNMAAATGAAALNHLIVFYPGGATTAQIASYIANSGGNTTSAPITTTLPSPVYYTWDFRQQNVLNLSIQGIDIDAHYRFDTDEGTFTLGDALTQFLSFNQQVGANGVKFSVLNTSGFNQTFPSIATQMRATINWALDGFMAQFAANYTGAYKNWSSTAVNPVTTDAFGNPSGGGDHVDASTYFDLHASYDFAGGFMGDDQVYVDVTNVFDTRPPFFNSALGYNNYNSNPIGRIVEVGLRGKW